MRTTTRHQLKQDKFAEATADTFSWAVENRSKLIWAGIVAVAVVAIAAGVYWYFQYQDQQASVVLAKAMATYEAPVVPPGTPSEPGFVTFNSVFARAAAAHEEFDKVAAGYPHTHSGDIARYMAAVTDITLGKNRDAEEELKKIASSGNKDLAALSRLALANLYRDSNRDSEAVQLYKELIDKPAPTVSKSAAQLALADLYAAKQPDEARRLYQQIQKDDPKSAAAELAAQRLASKQ